jgi:hypothetical protein
MDASTPCLWFDTEAEEMLDIAELGRAADHVPVR